MVMTAIRLIVGLLSPSGGSLVIRRRRSLTNISIYATSLLSGEKLDLLYSTLLVSYLPSTRPTLFAATTTADDGVGGGWAGVGTRMCVQVQQSVGSVHLLKGWLPTKEVLPKTACHVICHVM